MLPDRLTWIDETNRGQHAFLQEGDQCLYFGVSRSRRFPEQPYKSADIQLQEAADEMSAGRTSALPQGTRSSRYWRGHTRAISREPAERLTWVPVPTSKVVGDPDYDDRLIRALGIAFDGYDTDVRSLLRQTESTEPDHAARGQRLTRDELLGILEVDQPVLDRSPLRQKIVLFDDVLVSGKHFKCCEERLRDVVPAHVPIIGIFVARCVFPAATAEEFGFVIE